MGESASQLKAGGRCRALSEWLSRGYHMPEEDHGDGGRIEGWARLVGVFGRGLDG